MVIVFFSSDVSDLVEQEVGLWAPESRTYQIKSDCMTDTVYKKEDSFP